MPTFTSHDDATLHYDLLGETGRNDPVVVLAGGAALHPQYLGDLGGLDAARALAVLHQRGVGASATPDVRLAAYPDLAHDVDALRAHRGLETFDLLGHSAGTRVAMAYAAANPARLRRLCLVTPPSVHLVDVDDDRPEMIARRGDESWFPAYEAEREALERADSFEEHRRLSVVAAPLSWSTWDDRARAHEAGGVWFPDAAKAFFSADPPADLRDRLTRLGAPVLVVAGGDDASTGLRPVLALADLFPCAHSVVIENAGHFPWVEQPAEFRAAVGAFLAPIG